MTAMVTLAAESTDAKSLHAKRAFSYALVEEKNNKYIDPATGMLYAHAVETRPCPACGADSPMSFLRKHGGQYVTCTACTMVYLNPTPTDATLAKYYAELDTKQGEIVAGEGDFYRSIYGRGLDAIERHVQKGTLLDVGCSTGFFLDLARERGWQTFGVEPGRIEADECAKKGHTLYVDTLENLHFDRTFDAITLWDVFEHVPNGVRCLDMLAKALSPTGVVFLQIPNSDSLAPKMLREECHMFDGLEHCNLYNPKAITTIAGRCGYEIVEMKSVISEIAVMNNFLSYSDPYTGESRYDNTKGLLGLIDETFIHDNLIGYKLQVVLRKK